MKTTATIIGSGMTPVGEYWEKSLRELAAEAGQIALQDAGMQTVDALYVANAYSSTFNHQSHLGTLIADYMGLKGVEACTIEAADASGGVALRNAAMAVLSGMIDTALVIGVEMVTDIVGEGRTAARTISLDADYEVLHGSTLPAMAALLMRRYMMEYEVSIEAFEGFSINAHANGKKNPLAMFRNTLRQGAFLKAPMVADPVSLFDSAPDADGAAAVVITRSDLAQDLVPQPIHIVASSVATDTLMLQERNDMLTFSAVQKSVEQALTQANIQRDEIDLFEVHDSFTIQTALTLESAGFAPRGEGWKMASESEIGLSGRIPISTFGGLKSRGNPAGASGIYQAAEATLQLRGIANENQISDASIAMIQSVGGLGSTVATHIFRVSDSL